MEDIKIEKKLPDVFILEDDYRKCKTTWMAVLGSAQRAFDELINDRDVGDCLPDFGELDSRWIKDFVAQKVDAVMHSPNTYAARVEAANEWREIEKDLLKKVSAVERLRQIDPNAEIEVKGCHLLISNMEELLREKTTFNVPDWYKEYYSLIVDAAEMVNRLRAYQKEHGVRTPIQPYGVLSFAGRPDDFIKHLIFEERMKDVEVPPSYASMLFNDNANFKKTHAKEIAEREKNFEHARAEKISKGEQVDFGVSIKMADGRLVPVDKN